MKTSFLRQCRADPGCGCRLAPAQLPKPDFINMRHERCEWAWLWLSGSPTSKMKGSFIHVMLHVKVHTKRGRR